MEYVNEIIDKIRELREIFDSLGMQGEDWSKTKFGNLSEAMDTELLVRLAQHLGTAELQIAEFVKTHVEDQILGDR